MTRLRRVYADGRNGVKTACRELELPQLDKMLPFKQNLLLKLAMTPDSSETILF